MPPRIDVSKLDSTEKIKAINGLRRGDVITVNLTRGAVGKELRKLRPCVVVSRDDINKNQDTIIVVPLTTHDGDPQPKPYEVPIAAGEGDLDKAGVATPFKLRNIDPAERVVEIWGRLSDVTMRKIEEQLAYDLGMV